MNEIKTEDVYKDFNHHKEMFDFSNYSKKSKYYDNSNKLVVGNYSTMSKYYDNSNKLVVGKLKDETAGIKLEEFVGLKPKMYSYLVDDNSEHKKAKGVNRILLQQ